MDQNEYNFEWMNAILLIEDSYKLNIIETVILLLYFLAFRMPSSEDKPASFIGKLCNILRSKQNSKIICWDTDAKGIRILNQKRLQETILPRYFRHNRYTSFVRQLNMYDFHKVHLQDHRAIFLHDTFDPKNKENIHLIRRKITFEQKSLSDKDKDKHVSQIVSQKENNEFDDPFFKNCKNVISKQSIVNFITSKHNNLEDSTQTEALEEVIKELAPLLGNRAQFQQKYQNLKTNKRYRRYLKFAKFRLQLSTKLGVDWIQNNEVLSQLSIEDQLMFKSRKSLPPKSLRLLESGQLEYKKETIGNLFSIQ